MSRSHLDMRKLTPQLELINAISTYMGVCSFVHPVGPPAKLISTYLIRATQLHFTLARHFRLLGFMLGNGGGIATTIALFYPMQGMHVYCSIDIGRGKGAGGGGGGACPPPPQFLYYAPPPLSHKTNGSPPPPPTLNLISQPLALCAICTGLAS